MRVSNEEVNEFSFDVSFFISDDDMIIFAYMYYALIIRLLNLSATLDTVVRLLVFAVMYSYSVGVCCIVPLFNISWTHVGLYL